MGRYRILGIFADKIRRTHGAPFRGPEADGPLPEAMAASHEWWGNSGLRRLRRELMIVIVAG
jgi:hypothetical protein